jgi:REG-2-like HAD superfamily hydrolase
VKRGLLVDAVGTLIAPSEPITRTYARLSRAHGGTRSEAAIATALPLAMARPRPATLGDGRSHWQGIVTEATGCPDCFGSLYAHFAHRSAWTTLPGAAHALDTLRGRGWKTAMVSNFDTRLRPLLDQMGLLGLFDHLSLSGELGMDKPDPRIFGHALAGLGVEAKDGIHVGDEPANDGMGAEGAGLRALIVGRDLGGLADLPTHPWFLD